jgi:hypothetical protein
MSLFCVREKVTIFSAEVYRGLFVWGGVSPPGLRIIAVLQVPFCGLLEQPLVLMRFLVEIFRLFSWKLAVLLSVSVSDRFRVPLEKVLFGATSNVSQG